MPESCSNPFALNKHLVSSYSESGAGLGTGNTQVSKTDPFPTSGNLKPSGSSKERGASMSEVGGFCLLSVVFFFLQFFIILIFICNLNSCRTGRIEGTSALWSTRESVTELGIKDDFPS